MSQSPPNEPTTIRLPQGRLREVTLLFLRLGFTAFGGPAAHIALFREEMVRRRAWLTDQEFMDLLGATNLIPGPNSTEMAIHLGYKRAGWPGLIAAGLCFILPAASMVLLLAMLYQQYGTTPALGWLLYGIKPVIIAIVVQAGVALARTAIKSWQLAVIGAGVVALYALGMGELQLLFGAGLVMLLWRHGREALKQLRGGDGAGMAGLALLPAMQVAASASVPFSLGTLFLTFLKIGSVLYGSGYVLLAFLRNDFVVHLGWLTDKQLLDAVVVGQFTPGPLFTTATFIGYLMGDVGGAVLATLGIFLPSFLFVALSLPLIPRLRRSPILSAVLDGVNAASLALMLVVAVQLGQAAIVDLWTLALALVAGVILLRFKVNSTLLVGAGALFGLLMAWFGLIP